MPNKILICHRPTTPPAVYFLLQRETKNEIPWGVCDKLFFKLKPKMKSTAGEGVAGLWQIIFQSERKNEIPEGFVGSSRVWWILKGMTKELYYCRVFLSARKFQI